MKPDERALRQLIQAALDLEIKQAGSQWEKQARHYLEKRINNPERAKRLVNEQLAAMDPVICGKQPIPLRLWGWWFYAKQETVDGHWFVKPRKTVIVEMPKETGVQP